MNLFNSPAQLIYLASKKSGLFPSCVGAGITEIFK